ncbi:MAG: hypothetical protein HYX68_17875 [Planctomycetes bacterium]|nr:hypothetical protein [Planctomycetota bacterium]
MRLHLTNSIAVFLACLSAQPLNAQAKPDAIRAAAIKSLALLEKSAAGHTAHRKCFSCHHQALPVLALTTAKARGFKVNDKEIARQTKWTADFLERNRDNYREGKGQGGQADTAGYALWTLAAGAWKADATTDAVVDYLLQRDAKRDTWRPVSQRPPSEASLFTTTFLVLRGLKHYTPKTRQKEMAARFDKASKWLANAKAKDTEDHVFRLRALEVVGAKPEVIRAAREGLLKAQRKDGGWAQLAKLESDAYATGSVLATLHQVGGLATGDAAYQRGLEFLLKSQKDDGSWHIVSRSRPFQTYFETGFPHRKDQFISCAGSSWAMIALTLACDGGKK